jgi:hypothetical protein
MSIESSHLEKIIFLGKNLPGDDFFEVDDWEIHLKAR